MKKGYNIIAVIICRLIKRRILKLIIDISKGIDAEATTKLVYLNIRRLGVGIINTFTSDQGL